MELVYVTGNTGKYKSLAHTMQASGITLVQEVLDIPEIQSVDLEEVALAKATYATRVLGKPCVVNDAGFCLEEYCAFPGAFTKFALETIGVEGLLKLAVGGNRRCYFKGVFAFTDGTTTKTFTSYTPGTLATERRGVYQDWFWSDLYYVFIPDGTTRTFAEMTEEEYRAWSVQEDIPEKVTSATIGAHLAEWVRGYYALG